METEKLKKYADSKTVRKAISILIITLALLMTFWAGIQVGFSKAAFNYRVGENYYGTFGPRPIRQGIIPNDISGAHGVSGKIISIALPTVIIADHDNTEKVVRVGDTTSVRRLRDTIEARDLVVGDFVVVLGSPIDGSSVDAKLIRILPPPEEAQAMPTMHQKVR